MFSSKFSKWNRGWKMESILLFCPHSLQRWESIRHPYMVPMERRTGVRNNNNKELLR
jgi:hypothetical protein